MYSPFPFNFGCISESLDWLRRRALSECVQRMMTARPAHVAECRPTKPCAATSLQPPLQPLSLSDPGLEIPEGAFARASGLLCSGAGVQHKLLPRTNDFLV